MNRWQHFFQGIYGIDGLSCGLLLLSVVLNLITAFFPVEGISRWNIICLIPLLVCLFRYFSHDIAKRERENEIFMDWISPLLEREKKEKPEKPEKENKKLFKYFKCPACKQKIRVPKGKGKIEITCPRCGMKFIKKT